MVLGLARGPIYPVQKYPRERETAPLFHPPVVTTRIMEEDHSARDSKQVQPGTISRVPDLKSLYML